MLKKRTWNEVTVRRRCSAAIALCCAAVPWGSTALAADAPEATDAVVGRVATVSGSVVAIRPDEAPRPLDCHDAIYSGEKVVTGEDSSVGLVVGDVLAQLDERSRLGVGRTETDAAALELESGAVRVIDPREEGEPAQLKVLAARAQIVGNDTEAYVFSEKTGGYAVLCEWDTPLSVTRLDESEVADPQRCVIAKPRERLYTADAHDERVSVPGEADCELGPLIGQLELHLDPAQVAAGPDVSPWSDVAPSLAMPPRSPCDLPGSGCLTAREPPATTGPVPGGGGVAFPGP